MTSQVPWNNLGPSITVLQSTWGVQNYWNIDIYGGRDQDKPASGSKHGKKASDSRSHNPIQCNVICCIFNQKAKLKRILIKSPLEWRQAKLEKGQTLGLEIDLSSNLRSRGSSRSSLKTDSQNRRRCFCSRARNNDGLFSHWSTNDTDFALKTSKEDEGKKHRRHNKHLFSVYSFHTTPPPPPPPCSSPFFRSQLLMAELPISVEETLSD